MYGLTPSGTNPFIDFYDGIQYAIDERTLPSYRSIFQDLTGSRALMNAEIVYREQLEVKHYEADNI